MLNLSRLDQAFTDEVMAEPGGENLLLCYSCGTCMSTCLVKRYNDEFNPRRLLRMVALGMREAALASPTYWLCSACDACYKRCPQNIHISDIMKAVRNVAVRRGYRPPFATAVVNEDKCSACAICVRACPYQAIHTGSKGGNGEERIVAVVDETLCMACGVCAGACPSLAIQVEDFRHEEMLARLGAHGWLDAPLDEPKIAAFVCNWCLRADEDVADLGEFPPNVRIVHVPCSGRVDPLLVLFALQQGADGVLVAGCKPGECHYRQGNYIEHGRLLLLQEMMTEMRMPPERVRFAQFGAADRGKFAQTVKEMGRDLATLDGGRNG